VASFLLAFGAERWWDVYVVAHGGPIDQWRVLVALTAGLATGIFLSVVFIAKLIQLRERRKLTLARKRD
jgi:hypothetical protein